MMVCRRFYELRMESPSGDDISQDVFPRVCLPNPLGGPTIPRSASCVQHQREARCAAPALAQVRSQKCCRAALAEVEGKP